jgi:PAS domain S-box-containing protein
MVIVGIVLDDAFAMQMRDQTGLEHTLLAGGQPVSTSLVARRSVDLAFPKEMEVAFDLNGHPYYGARFRLGEMALVAEVALDVSGIAMTQRQLVWALAGSILAVTAVALLLGTVLARRVGQPLADLAGAADAMSKGDLEGPLAVESNVREVTLLAQALDGARSDLKRSLAELRRQKAWSDHLLEAIVEGIVTLDRQGHITFFSHGAERITGWQRGQALGRTCDRIFKPLDTHEPFSQLIPPPGRRRKISVELRDGRHATLAVTGAQLSPPEGGDTRIALVFRDISEEEAVHRLLGHFLANVAHEFRTPLSSLAASVELLLDQAPELTADELQELLTSLHLGVLGLQTLIDNLLESASIEAGHFRVQPRPSALGDIIADAIAMMQPLLDKRGQQLVVELPLQGSDMPVVQADPRRTVQVLVNLLSNASKYGPDDAEIAVLAAMQGEWIRISVTDSGPGVPAEHRQDLFRRFVHPGLGNDRAQVGAGLGLSVVKAVVEAHGGAVGVEDRPGGGLVFWFTLPLAAHQSGSAH